MSKSDFIFWLFVFALTGVGFYPLDQLARMTFVLQTLR